MISKSRTIDLVSKLNPTVFALKNKDIFGTVEQSLSSNQGAVTRILSPEYEQLLKTIMPNILSISPNDSTWYKRVRNYFDSFGIKVPVGGRKLEIGFNFDINDTTRKVAISDLSKNITAKEIVIDSDETLANYVLKNIGEFDKYKYGSLINSESYIIWLFCLGHREVAKQSGALDKSTNINFILIDPKDIDDNRKANHAISTDAIKKYLEILTDRSKVRDILYIKGMNASTFDDLDADMKLKHLVDTSPKEFLTIVNDSTMTTKARIERYCISGILRRLSNSSIIVDATDNGIVIGNTLDDAVVYFSSEAPDRAAKVKEFKTRYAQLSKVNN